MNLSRFHETLNPNAEGVLVEGVSKEIDGNGELEASPGNLLEASAVPNKPLEARMTIEITGTVKIVLPGTINPNPSLSSGEDERC